MEVQVSPMVKTKTRITYEEYRALPEDSNRYKVIRGELLMTAARAEDETFQPSLFPNLTISLSELWQ